MLARPTPAVLPSSGAVVPAAPEGDKSISREADEEQNEGEDIMTAAERNAVQNVEGRIMSATTQGDNMGETEANENEIGLADTPQAEISIAKGIRHWSEQRAIKARLGCEHFSTTILISVPPT